LNEPVGDIHGNGDYTRVVAIVTRGSLGGNADHTIGVYAAGDDGEPIEDDGRWTSIIDEVATPDPDFGITEVLARYGIRYSE
jgi:hypothetical protein